VWSCLCWLPTAPICCVKGEHISSASSYTRGLLSGQTIHVSSNNQTHISSPRNVLLTPHNTTTNSDNNQTHISSPRNVLLTPHNTTTNSDNNQTHISSPMNVLLTPHTHIRSTTFNSENNTLQQLRYQLSRGVDDRL
jgi:hypothetical protein